MKQNGYAKGWMLFSPWIITFLVFWFFPLVYSLVISLTDYRLLDPSVDWIGFANYSKLFSDADFISSLKNSFIFVIGTIPFTTAIALALALLLNEKFKGRTFFRAAYFMPSITSMVVIALIFSNLYARGGYLHLLADMIGLAPPANGFLLSENSALASIMAMDIWMASGYYMLLFLGGLQTIPTELYEAATISGASKWHQFRYITLPMLKPVTLFIIVINSIKSFQVFIEIFVMTKGGPLNSTFTGVYFVYENGLRKFDFGYASAAAYVLFAIIAIASVIQFKFLKTEWKA
ncbi:MAG: sugar ABC transporter permease [candidate division Zixibacteria bacterium]|nr:sugar ABC transporter permease [candidate division Zixibacteria bacterium]